MPTYAVKTKGGCPVECASWGHDDADLPDGYVVASREEYLAAKQGLMFSLPIQATGALHAIKADAAMAVAMGQTFGPQMRAHVEALQAISNGGDTTSTSLPPAPSSTSD